MSSPARIVIKRAAVGIGCALVATAGLLGVEIYLALHRDFLPTSPALVIEGTYGPPAAQELRFVVLGDSTAAGVGAGSETAAYPTLLAEALAREGRRVHLTGIGVSGARVADVLSDQVPRAIELDPDLIFVGIGANDATHLTSLGDVERDMRSTIDALQTHTSAVLVVAGAPDMRATAFLEPLRSIVGWRGARVAETIEEVARDAGVPAVPLAERTAPYFVADPEEHYSPDDFHPGAAGYARWAGAILPVLEAALAEAGR